MPNDKNVDRVRRGGDGRCELIRVCRFSAADEEELTTIKFAFEVSFLNFVH